jgi:peroxiredoxin
MTGKGKGKGNGKGKAVGLIAKGDVALEMRLTDHEGKEFVLSSFRGRKVLLSFHPLAWTPVCSKQMKALDDNQARFEALGTVAVGVNVDHVPSKAAWAKELGLKGTRLLSDFWPHGAAAKAFGIFREEDGFSERANIVIDDNGRVRWVKVYPIAQLPDIEEIISVLR